MPGHGLDEDEDKPCRACSDFKSWAKTRSKAKPGEAGTSAKNPEPSVKPDASKECPLDKDDLGRATWAFLHTMASYYPKKPTRQQSDQMSRFFCVFAQFYPCEPCAAEFQEDIRKNPPRTTSRDDLARWLCERHNAVNIKLDKPSFDCSKVHERWRDGWKDGSCD